MTEAEWLAQPDPKPMLKYLRRRLSRRKIRLFIAEAAWPLYVGCVPPCELAPLPRELDLWADSRDANQSTPTLDDFLSVLAHVTGVPLDWATLFWNPDWLTANRLVDRAEMTERRRCAVLLRDIAGNPFRPVAFSPAWQTDTSITLARQMYESQEFSAMPILADALQDAGCDHGDILNHCRDTSLTHVRGCWVVDLVLGKS